MLMGWVSFLVVLLMEVLSPICFSRCFWWSGNEDRSLVGVVVDNIVVSNLLCCRSYVFQKTGGLVVLLAEKILASLCWLWAMSSMGVRAFLSNLISNSSWKMSEVTAIRCRFRVSWALMMNGRPKRVLIGRSLARPI